MMIKEVELVESFRDFNLGVVLTPYSLRLNQVRVTSDFRGQIAQAQRKKEDFLKAIVLVGEGKPKGFCSRYKWAMGVEWRVFIPATGDL